MDIIIYYIAVGIVAYVVANLFIKLVVSICNGIKELIKKKIEERKLKKEQWQFSKIEPDNPLLLRIVKNRLICFMGAPGKGKSIMMNIISRFLYLRREKYIKKKTRYYKHMNPKVLLYQKKMKDGKVLSVYSNLEFKDKETGFKNQELLPYIQMKKQAVKYGVFCIDENSTLFGKDLYYEQQKNKDPVIEEMKELYKKIRHYLDGWILMTEQNGDNIFKGFRDAGYSIVEAKQTVVKVSVFGRILSKVLNFCNLVLPGFLTANKTRVYQNELFEEARKKLKFKLLLPTYFLLPQEYYTRQNEIKKMIEDKYTKFITRFEFEGKEYYLKYDNSDKFIYNTRAYESEYNRKFNADGERIEYA